jgi:TatD DNase family protein
LIDVGVNLTNSRFADDIEQVLNRAQQSGVNKLLITGTNIAESEQAVRLCEINSKRLFSTAGIHPHDADKATDDFINQLTSIAAHQSVKAIGECGLDFNRNFSTPENQIAVFKAQIKLAGQLNMPLFLHQRDAFDLWFELLSPYFNKVPAMIAHCFTGDKAQLEQCLQAGMYIGITGWVCDERRGKDLRELIADIPLNRLLLETDAPYLLPRNIKPRPKSNRNEPSFLTYIVEEIANNSKYSRAQIITQTSLNAEYAFGFSVKDSD